MRALLRFPAIVAFAAALAACDDDPVTPVTSTCMTEGPVAQILDNHLPSGGDHALDIPAADVVAAVEKTYDIRGDNVGHTHTVTVTAADFLSLQDGDSVALVSSNNGPVGFGHEHNIELTCPAL